MKKQESSKNFKRLRQLYKEIKVLTSISHLLEWDQATGMPSGGASLRAEQLEMMAQLSHNKQSSKSFLSALSKCIDIETGSIIDKSLTSIEARACSLWRRDYLLTSRLPSTFIKLFAKTSSLALNAWGQAKKENSFLQFAPFLEKIVTLSRQKADYLGYEDHPYDALIDQYEPDMTTHMLSAFFNKLKKPLSSLHTQILAQKPINDDFLRVNYSIQKQEQLTQQVLDHIEFSRQCGSLSLSQHPFCLGLSPKDVRITTQIKKNFLPFCFLATLHEAGHGFYEQHLPIEQWDTPIGEPLSFGIHESQSRFLETFIGQSYPFLQYFFPVIKKLFPAQLKEISLTQFYKAINRVTRCPIRVESDEVSYNLHIILRVEIEKALIDGSLKIKAIPDIWNEKMKQYLGKAPKNNSEGCLQDIHWALGLIGYFPTYTLGNVYAGQLFEAFEKAHADWKKKIAKGEFSTLKEWLYQHIHQHGRRYPVDQLIKSATGKKTSTTPYLNYLQNKYQKLYTF